MEEQGLIAILGRPSPRPEYRLTDKRKSLGPGVKGFAGMGTAPCNLGKKTTQVSLKAVAHSFVLMKRNKPLCRKNFSPEYVFDESDGTHVRLF
jgi:hypothetical protein